LKYRDRRSTETIEILAYVSILEMRCAIINIWFRIFNLNNARLLVKRVLEIERSGRELLDS
jgi:hypothetical protein